MSPRTLSALLATLLLAACPSGPTGQGDATSQGPLDAATSPDAAAAGLDAAAPGADASGWDASAALDASTPSSRTLIERSLYGTSPRNLLLDPFVTGDRSWGHFISFFLGSPSEHFALPRTFESASPTGMAAPIVLLAAGGGGSDAGSRPARVVTPVLGGGGTFSASLWLSASDASGAPVPFASVSTRVAVAVFDPTGVTKVVLAPDPSATKTIGGREWTLLRASTLSLPHGGWFQAQVTDLTYSWRLAGPELVADQPAPPRQLRRPAAVVPATDEDRAAIVAYGQFVERK